MVLYNHNWCVGTSITAIARVYGSSMEVVVYICRIKIISLAMLLSLGFALSLTIFSFIYTIEIISVYIVKIPQ